MEQSNNPSHYKLVLSSVSIIYATECQLVEFWKYAAQ